MSSFSKVYTAAKTNYFEVEEKDHEKCTDYLNTGHCHVLQLRHLLIHLLDHQIGTLFILGAVLCEFLYDHLMLARLVAQRFIALQALSRCLLLQLVDALLLQRTHKSCRVSLLLGGRLRCSGSGKLSSQARVLSVLV
jgi:hypothetical protein